MPSSVSSPTKSSEVHSQLFLPSHTHLISPVVPPLLAGTASGLAHVIVISLPSSVPSPVKVKSPFVLMQGAKSTQSVNVASQLVSRAQTSSDSEY